MNALGKEEPKLKPTKNKEQTSESTRLWCGTVVLSSTAWPCQSSVRPWLGFHTKHGWKCFVMGVFASSFGVVLAVFAGEVKGMNVMGMKGYEGVSKWKITHSKFKLVITL